MKKTRFIEEKHVFRKLHLLLVNGMAFCSLENISVICGVIVIVGYLFQGSAVYNISSLNKQRKGTAKDQELGRLRGHYNLNPESSELTTYDRRLKQIKTVCERVVSIPVKPGFNFYVLPGYNVSYCKVPKCGSTLWMQMIRVLNIGVDHIDDVLNDTRREIHKKWSKLKTFDEMHRSQMKTIVTSRDPYTRLFSAFVDKSYLAFRLKSNYSSGLHSAKRSGNCSAFNRMYMETFKLFLDRVLWDIKNDTTTSNRHWTPVATLCNPCGINVFIHIKLEHFQNDLAYLFSKIGFPSELQQQLKRLTVSKQESLRGIAATMFLREKSYMCQTKEGIAERLWKSFQIQGYIKETAEFPLQVFQHKLHTNKSSDIAQMFMKLVESEMTQNPLTTEESANQRRHSLVKAYKTVRNDTIKGIQNVFKLDFLMFNYSTFRPI